MKIKKALSLLSGGIDSPVASYLLIKAGVEIVLVHFYNQKAGIETKIASIAELLTKHQAKIKLYLVNFRDAQLEIIKAVPSEYRMIIYRRLMFMIANEIAKKENCEALVTGDSIGQVASQTLENINTIHAAAKLPVLTPLLGMDKEEIIKKAKEIGSYETSIAPYLDCCSFVIGKHPATKAMLSYVENLEKNLDMKAIVKNCVKQTKTRIFGY